MYLNWIKKIDTKELEKIVELLKKDEIIIFPTETVYGIGGNALSSSAVSKIFVAKGRPQDNPLIVHVSDYDMLYKYVDKVNEIEEKLIKAFMPGPFTLILPKKSIIPNVVSAGLDTIGIRMPKNEIAKTIIEKFGLPIAAPSANISGKPSGTNIDDIKTELEDKVSAIIDGGLSQIGLESTVVKVINGIPVILRPGKITPDQIAEVAGKVEIDRKVFEEVLSTDKPESPGMKYKHYAPKTKCKLFYSENENSLIDEINKNVITFNNNVVVLGFKEHKERINVPSDKFIEVSSKNNLEEYAKNIYTSLRKADFLNSEIILIEGVKREKLGIAIMNRLIRTCEHDFIEI